MEVESVLARLRRFHPKELLRVRADQFYEELVKGVSELCGTEMNSLYLLEPDGQHLSLQAAVGLPASWVAATGRIPVGDADEAGVCGRAAALKRVVATSNFDGPRWSRWRSAAHEAGLHALWSTPLIDTDGCVIGTFATYYRESREPTEAEITKVARVAREAAHIIELARLFYDREAILRLHERAKELAQHLVSRKSPEKVFEAIVGGLKQLIGVDVVWMQYMSTAGQARLYQSEPLFDSPPVYRPELPCYEALQKNKPVIRTNFQLAPVLPVLRPERFATLTCHPVHLEDGQLVVSAAWRRSFCVSAEQLAILDLFAKFAGIAMQNATRLNDLRASYYGMMRGLLMSLEVRDFETIAHSRRVVTYTLLTAELLGIGPKTMDEIALGAALHDIGKIGISDSILHKPGKLTAAEYEVVKQHPIIGHRMLKDTLGHSHVALNLVRHHHERYDGRGYPDRLSGEDIPPEARILAVADAFDVMTTDRPYKQGRPIAAARDEVATLRGSQFCPWSADALLSLDLDVLEAVRQGELDRTPFAELLQ